MAIFRVNIQFKVRLRFNQIVDRVRVRLSGLYYMEANVMSSKVKRGCVCVCMNDFLKDFTD